jgi:signal transduction histidine kinase
MMKNSIVFKLSVTIVLLSFIMLFPLGFTINKMFSGFYYNELETELEELADNYSKLITSLEDPNVLNMYETLAHMMNQEIFIVNQHGVVVVNSGFPGLAAGMKINENDFTTIRNGHTLSEEYVEANTRERYLTIGKPIIRDNQFVGGLFISASVKGIYDSINRVEKMIILASIGSILVAFGLAFFLSRRLSEPLLKMEETTRKIAKGDLASRVHVGAKDELGSLAQAINDLAIELQRYRSNRREFFANISHELRTPITYIDGFTNAIKKKLYKSEEEKKQMLQLIDQESKRMIKLVDDLFELAKMEEEKLSLYLEEIKISDVIEASIAKTKLKANEKAIELKISIRNTLPPIVGDRLRLEQIIINLLENAIRYTEEGKIEITAWQEKNNVCLSIEDTGIGIPNKEIPYLFERFYRVDKSRSRNLGGTGLGLAIVKNLVELHQGEIHVESTEGEGTTFILRFPVRKEGE